MINPKAEFHYFIQKLHTSPEFKKRFWRTTAFSIFFTIFCIWIYNQFHVSTDDAYINANIVQIAPQISGRVAQVYVTNNQTVKKGQLLFDIDPLPYLIALDRAKAQLALAHQEVAEKNEAVTAAAAEVALREAEWRDAKSTADRTLQLVKRKVLSQQSGDDTRARFQKATASLEAAKAKLSETKINLGKLDDSNVQVQLAKANLRNAELNYSYTRVTAPFNGTIANLTLQNGAVVSPNHPLFALINNQEYWVDSNFKETTLKNIHPGQRAEIEIDMYPGHIFKGIVESISGGSGNAFSIFPAQNATGNWVKIAQRIPVRVRIIEQNPKFPLRIGSSANVIIFT